MADYITLVGAEDVKRAASQMQQAADSISKSVGALDYALQQHQRFLNDWLQRLEAVYESEAAKGKP